MICVKKYDNLCCLLYIIIFIITGCSTTKHVPEKDYLYKGVSFTVDSGKIDKEILDGMGGIVKPKTNSSIVGLPLKLMLYQGAPDTAKKNGFITRATQKWSEPPVLLSQVKPEINKTRLGSYLYSYGYFNPYLEEEVLKKNKDAKIKYHIKPGIRYQIRDIYYPTDSSEVSKFIAGGISKSEIKKGDFINLGLLENERKRIDNELKNNGYYFFHPEYILYRTDSNHNGKLDIYYTVKDQTPNQALQTWNIGEISVYGNYSIERDSIITQQKGKREKRFALIDKQERYKAEVYERAFLIREGQQYDKVLHTLSIERLMNLSTFRFVKMSFFPDTLNGKNLLNTRVYITPMKRNTLRMEAAASTKTGNFLGSELSIKLRNVNAFHGAEILDLKLSGGYDAQIGGSKSQSPNAYSARAELGFYIPKIIPNVKLKTGRNSFLPRTGITMAAEFIRRPELYTQRTFRTSLEYIWKTSKSVEHTFRPIRVQLIDPSRTTPAFDSILAEDITLKASFEKQLILGSNYEYVFNNTYKINRTFTQAIRFNAGSSGNIFNLIARDKNDTPNAVKLFNLPVSQFLRFEAEWKGFQKLNATMVWANRLITGVSGAYGNSTHLPYAEQFFIGGSSSIRAFRIRTLGPGSYHTSEKVYQANESGEIKLEVNSELRYSLNKYVKLAGFVDAGNIWLQKDVADKPGSGLSKGDLWKELAVGTGLGIRFDFSVLILRFDLAIPIRKPWYAEGDRWVFDEVNFGDKNWRKENLIFNIGIGYPF